MPKRITHAGSSSKLRAGRISVDWECYAVTKVVLGRKPVLNRPNVAPVLLDSLEYLRQKDRIKLFAFCVMPDHLHTLFCLMPGERISSVVGSFSKFTARSINRLTSSSGPFWQEGFHDRHCRNRRELESFCQYIEHNPVRAGLVAEPQTWAFSSASADRKVMLDREWWP